MLHDVYPNFYDIYLYLIYIIRFNWTGDANIQDKHYPSEGGLYHAPNDQLFAQVVHFAIKYYLDLHIFI